MPHCIIEYSKEVENTISPKKLLKIAHQGTFNTGFFDEKAIKSRAIPFEHYLVGGEKLNFIHITIRILSGRTEEQRATISNSVLEELKKIELSSISLTVEICEIDKESYAKLVL